jgi:hypothetical protein
LRGVFIDRRPGISRMTCASELSKRIVNSITGSIAMFDRQRTSSGPVAAVLLAVLVAGCGKQAPPDASSRSMPPAVTFDEAPGPVVEHHAADDDLSRVESELEYSAGDAVSKCEILPAEVQPQRLLTAGSLDDVKNDDEFRTYVDEVRQSGIAALSDTLTGWSGRRIEIMVRNSEGKPFPDAIVNVFATAGPEDSIQLKYQPATETVNSKRLVASLQSGSDGRAHFFPGIDGRRDDAAWDIEISTPDGELRVSQESLPVPQAWWDFTVGKLPSQMPRQLNLALVIDTTGSMGDELEYLKREISNIASQVERLFPGIDQRFALIVYRDNGDRYVTRNFDFTDSLAEFRKSLSVQHASGGGDYPEAMHAALEQAGELSWRDRNTARVMFLVGDAPPHARHMTRTFDAVQKLRQKNVSIFPVAGSGTRDEAEFALRTAAFMTMGQYLFLTDHSGVGLPHAAPHAETYNVEWLSSVMLRMIASELSGRELQPSEILATEETAEPLLAQSSQQAPRFRIPQSQDRVTVPFLSAVLWEENRPLVALALLLLLAMAERFFTRRPVASNR